MYNMGIAWQSGNLLHRVAGGGRYNQPFTLKKR